MPESDRSLSELGTTAVASPGGINENMQANGIPDDRQSVSSTDNLVDLKFTLKLMFLNF